MKMTKRLITQAKRMRAARLQTSSRTFDEAYAQLDRFMKGNETVQSGERSSNGAKNKVS